MKKTMSRILTLVLVLAMLVGVVPMALAAENDAGSITIVDPGTVKAGESVTLTANVIAKEGYTAGNVTWSGSGVSADGTFKADDANSYTVTAKVTFTKTDDQTQVELSADTTINVVAAEAAVVSVTVNGPSAMVIGQESTVSASVVPAEAKQDVTWNVSGDSVTFDQATGKVRGGQRRQHDYYGDLCGRSYQE